MRSRLMGSLMLTLLAALLITTGLPAQAGFSTGQGVTGTDPAGDATSSPTCVDDGTATTIRTNTTGQVGPTIPGTGQQLPPGKCNNPVPELDVTGFSIGRSDNPLKNSAGNDGVYNTLDCVDNVNNTTNAAGADLLCDSQNASAVFETSADDPGPGPDLRYGTSDDVLASSITATVPTIEASWTLAAPLPKEKCIAQALTDPACGLQRRGDASLDTMTYYMHFRNPDLLDNRPTVACKRDTWTPARPTYSLLGMLGHKDDQFQQHIAFEMTFGPEGYVGKVEPGWYTPYDDAGYTFIDIKANNALNPWDNSDATKGTVADYTGKGIFWDYSISGDRKTVTVRLPGIIPSQTNACFFQKDAVKLKSSADPDGGWERFAYGIMRQPILRTASQKADPSSNYDFTLPTTGGIGSTTYKRPANSATAGIGKANNDVALSVFTKSFLATSVTLPEKVPLSIVPGEEDLESIGGLLFTVDTYDKNGVQQVQYGPFSHNVGISYPFQFPSAGCWTATFGGTAPTNPLHTGGVKCGVVNPEGDNWFDTLNSFSYGS